MKRKKGVSLLLSAVMLFSPAAAVMPSLSARAGSSEALPVYRLYNPNSGEHHYTKDKDEKDFLAEAGWNDEGIGWYSPEYSGAPVYRLYDPNFGGDHHYTVSEEEKAICVAAGWIDEGIGWYAGEDINSPVYREYNPNAVSGSHNYTMDRNEHEKLVSLGWRDEGICWYSFGTGEVLPAEFDPSDPYIIQYFKDNSDRGLLETKGEGVSFEIRENENSAAGIFVSGKTTDVCKAKISFSSALDFGSEPAERIRVDALAEKGSNTVLELFLDDEEIPFSSVTLDCQKSENDWDLTSPVFASVEKGILTGAHHISVRIREEANKAEDKVLLKSIRFYRQTIPLLEINIDESRGTIEAMNSSPDHSAKCYGDIKITVPKGYESEYSKDYTGGTYELEFIRGRGNSTWLRGLKKPYHIKLAQKADLFGMGKEKQWALIGNIDDNSLIRNRITYHTGEAMGFYYTPRSVPCDVVMNGRYLGSYCLSETVRISKNRLNIDNLEDIAPEEENITGGYLVGFIPYKEEKGFKFETENKVSFVLQSPEELSDETIDPSRLEEMREYIRDYVTKADEAVYGENYCDKEGNPYTDYIDLDSAALMYLFQMFSSNQDAFITNSTRMYKPKDDKLYFGPLWDFDMAYGAWDYNDYDDEEYAGTYSTFTTNVPWFNVLVREPVMVQKIKELWGENGDFVKGTFRYEVNEMIKDGGLIDKYAAELKDSAEANFDLPTGSYNKDFGWIIPYEEKADPETIINVYNDEKRKFSNESAFSLEIERLKSWMRHRMEWLDANIDGLQDYKEEY